MPSVFETSGGALYAKKSPGGKFDYTLTWKLEAGDSIATATWTVSPAGGSSPVVKSGQTENGNRTTIWLAGGNAGTDYLVNCHIVTTAGREDDQSFSLLIRDPATLGAGIPTAFPSLPAAVAAFRRDRLMSLLARWNPRASLDDQYLLDQLLAAESEIAHRLRVFTSPREMIPPGTPQDEIDQLIADGQHIEREPGYDYDPGLFIGNRWGSIDLRQSPAIKVHRIWFTYPGPGSSIYRVPVEWVRLDPRPGLVNLVPDGSPLDIPLNAYILSAIGGGRVVPLMIQVRYRAGLENAARDFPELLRLIQMQAALNILNDRFIPTSGSVSADGLSQSISFTADTYQKQIDPGISRLRSAIKGITGSFGVL